MLRMNKDFMEFMRTYYPHVASEAFKFGTILTEEDNKEQQEEAIKALVSMGADFNYRMDRRAGDAANLSPLALAAHQVGPLTPAPTTAGAIAAEGAHGQEPYAESDQHEAEVLAAICQKILDTAWSEVGQKDG